MASRGSSSQPLSPPAPLEDLAGLKPVSARRGGLSRLLAVIGIGRPRVDDAGSDAAEGQSPRAEDSQEECVPAGFGDLPEHLLERIFRQLAGSRRQHHFAICGVNRTWRRLGRALYFASPWQVAHLICHPCQLFCLSPHPVGGSRSGLLKCFVRRETKPQGGGGPRFTFYIGKDHRAQHRARFLLCAVQASRSEVLFYLNSRAEGRPIGRLAANGFATHYRLQLSGVALVLGEGSPAVPDDSQAGGAGASSCSCCAAGKGPSSPQLGDRLAHALSWEPREAAAAAAALCNGLSVFAELQYKARVKGFMQPRRMRVLLPEPSQLSFQQTLPQLAPTPTAATRPTLPFGRTSSSTAAGSGAAAGGAHSRTPSETAVAFGEGGVAGGGTPCCSGVASTEGASPSTPGSVGAGLAADPGKQSSSADGQQQPGGRRVNHLLQRLRLRDTAAAAGGGCTSGRATAPAQGAAAVTASEPPQPAAEQPSTPLALARRPPPPRQALPVGLRNKAPHWNDGLRCWCLNFRGRVKLASVKNFQLTCESDPGERVIMQFGKVATDAYILDFNPTVLTAFQAFAICLSTFDSKLML